MIIELGKGNTAVGMVTFPKDKNNKPYRAVVFKKLDKNIDITKVPTEYQGKQLKELGYDLVITFENKEQVDQVMEVLKMIKDNL
jgi:hypothetical protein